MNRKDPDTETYNRLTYFKGCRGGRGKAERDEPMNLYAYIHSPGTDNRVGKAWVEGAHGGKKGNVCNTFNNRDKLKKNKGSQKGISLSKKTRTVSISKHRADTAWD